MKHVETSKKRLNHPSTITANCNSVTLTQTIFRIGFFKPLFFSNRAAAALAAALDWVVECEWSDSEMASNPSLLPEIGPDGLAKEAPVIGYTEKVRSLRCRFRFALSLLDWFFIFIFIVFFLLLVSDHRSRTASIAEVTSLSISLHSDLAMTLFSALSQHCLDLVYFIPTSKSNLMI